MYISRRIVFILVCILFCLPARAAALPESFDPVNSLYEKGNEYFRRGAYTSAVSVFQLVSDNHPEHPLAPEALFSIASAKHKMNDLVGARSTYMELLQKYPTASAVPDAILQMGAVLAEMGDPSGAKASWGRLTKDYKGSIAARIAEKRLQTVESAQASPHLAPERPMATPAMPSTDAPMVHDAAKEPRVEPHRGEPLRGESHPAEEPASPPAEYVVKKGDSLSKIAKLFLGSTDRYKQLAKFNKISPPYTLEAGQIIKIPGKQPAPPSVSPASSSRSSAFPAVPMPFPPKDDLKEKAMSEWPAFPPTADMEKAVGSIQKWVDDRSEGYESLQTRLLDLQRDVRGQKLMEKQLELLKAQLEEAQTRNNRLKQELIDVHASVKEMKDKNLTLMSQMEGMADSVDRTKALAARSAEMDAQVKAYRQKMETMEKQNEILSETMQKMRDAFDAQMGLVKAYYDSQIAKTRAEYESKMDTTSWELSRLRDEARLKDLSLNELKKDYTDLIKKTATIQKEVIEEKQSRVSVAAGKQALEKARDLRRAGNSREAESAYKEALNVYPEYPDALNGLADLYAEEKRNLDEAEKLIERAIGVDPQGRGYYLDTLGWIHYVRMAYSAALDSLLEAHNRIPVEDLPARAAVSFHIGKVYQAMSDKDKAFFHFIDAIKLAPRTRWAALSERELDTL